jgi:hypothetical protein
MLGKLKSGEVVVDRYNSHIHETVKVVLPAALAQIESGRSQFLVTEIEFEKVIGDTTCIPTGPGDEVVFAKRPKRFGHTRFVKNRKPLPCSSVVVILKATTEGGYVLITAFVGHKAEPEPWDRHSNSKSLEFWSKHALVWGSEEVIPGTETERCPW